jgi:hypothetical protein
LAKEGLSTAHSKLEALPGWRRARAAATSRRATPGLAIVSELSCK